MKKRFLTVVLLCCGTSLFAQKIEVSVQAASGLFRFSGASATPATMILQGSTTGDPMNRANNPYGSKNGFSYGGGIQAQLVLKGGFIVGLQTGYEVLRSKADANRYSPIVTASNLPTITGNDWTFPLTGHVALQNQTINLNPYIGYRFQFNKVKLDILPGVDIGLMLSTRDKGEAKDKEGRLYKVDYERAKSPTDVRLRMGAAASYGRYALNASFAHGLTNYREGWIGGVNDAHSELWRLGLSYRLF
ncbi:outer membrane protein with beta-barrel domain [Mucilaginibacter oryzae]|uniref:Outer membrane protein with beta-barrel domain n=1 Tax=Mucilaginibacter oryzae TaxID=468058 RepID=A0A316HFC8_9SPHI|nr:outer membrane beta-barrel protein [Mucilaginibacter oryzae]PWK79929.1 outer membrane protein with beta-barrel domain [Mucilaginibacter oryzae]